MSTTLSKNFEPGAVEEKWISRWESKGYFHSTPDGRPPFTVVIPPPNVTGVLHMGHTLNETVQDVLVRKARMSGFNACWVPGSDHASIATEAKVVQMLEKEKGISKHQLSRDEFLRYAFEWKDKYGGIIYSQIRKLGCSVDWNRVNFTMDDHYYQAVIQVFDDLYKKGMIYRGARMINWDPAAQTALSDEEVEYRDVQGKLYYIRYRIAGSDDFILIATQRPETIMGDTGVCVHPSDERYAHLKGKKIIVPLINREVPLIFDEYVDPAFGTGALKVTPAHDINDYNLGLKHHLAAIDTLNPDGTLSEAAGIHIGMDRFEARKTIVQELDVAGQLEKVEEYPSRLGYSQRSQAVVEPRISTQWFVKMRELADLALESVRSGEVKIHPGERFMATYEYWLENVKDWCISRQLWWGQRIPAWYDEDGRFVVAVNENEAKEKYQKQFGEIRTLTQDEDVLDTWFSSWLWPMEVFHGITQPDNADFKYYYPTSVLVTGQDIIFFWVARMIMAGKEYTGRQPFSDVYFTGMVRDKQGRKMSKQLGNSPDLLQLIEKFGADAVRFGILISAPAGNDLLFDESSCEQGRNFNNKIWNALKLVEMWKASAQPSQGAPMPFAVAWFEQRLAQVRNEVEKMYQGFRLSEALKTIYSLIWDDFCSWYLEWIKPPFKGDGEAPAGMDRAVLDKTIGFFTTLMQMLHPFMPFITEEIAKQLDPEGTDLSIRQFEVVTSADPSLLQKGELLKNLITAIRDARNKNNIKPREPIAIQIQTPNQQEFSGIESVLSKQANANEIGFTPAAGDQQLTVVVGLHTLYLQTDAPLDQSTQKAQLLKDLEYQKGFLLSVEKKLSNERFVQNAKPEVVESEKRKKADALEKIKTLEESLSSLK